MAILRVIASPFLPVISYFGTLLSTTLILVALTIVLALLRPSAHPLPPLSLVTVLRDTLVIVVVMVPTRPLNPGLSPPKLYPIPPINILVVLLINPTLPIPILPTTNVPIVLTRVPRLLLTIGITTYRNGR